MAKRVVGKGTKFHSPIADSSPLWEVTRSRGRGVWEAKVIEDPDYKGEVRVFTTQQILQATTREGMFRSLRAASDNFYAGLKSGQVVHYHDSFGRFVRCEVVKGASGTKLKPIALVGNWDKSDLPRRGRNGEVIIGYHARNIAEGITFQPHASNIYECSPAGKADPRELPAHNLSVPELTPEQNDEARLWAAVKAAQAALVSNSNSPKACLEAALQVIRATI